MFFMFLYIDYMAMSKIDDSDIIYLDNNATTIVPQIVIDSMVKCLNLGNPSGLYKSAKFCQEIIKTFRDEIAKICEFNLDDYMVLFNSGASEGVNHIINATVSAYTLEMGKIPHIIVSDVEHSALMKCVDKLENDGKIELSKIKSHFRPITPSELKQELRPNTALISIMNANNETGIINNVTELKKVAPNIPFHTDATQYFGKLQFKMNVDAFCASFHKLHGPKGCGLLVIKKSFIDGYKMCPFICGTQNYGQRGGTEPIHDIAGSLAAFRFTNHNLVDKIDKISRMRAYIAASLLNHYKNNFTFIEDYNKNKMNGDINIVIMQPKNFEHTLPNTILLSVDRARICNRAIRNALEYKNIIVGLGSACSKGADSIVKTMGIPEHLLGGVIRISLSDMNTQDEIEKFVKTFIEVIESDKVLLEEKN